MLAEMGGLAEMVEGLQEVVLSVEAWLAEEQ